MSPVFPVMLTQLQVKALFVHGYATAEVKVDGMNETMTDAFLSGLKELQHASHLYFMPGVTDGH